MAAEGTHRGEMAALNERCRPNPQQTQTIRLTSRNELRRLRHGRTNYYVFMTQGADPRKFLRGLLGAEFETKNFERSQKVLVVRGDGFGFFGTDGERFENGPIF